jgi:hypothetical protein
MRQDSAVGEREGGGGGSGEGGALGAVADPPVPQVRFVECGVGQHCYMHMVNEYSKQLYISADL